MSFELALKKAGLPLVRSFLHSTEGVLPAMPAALKKRTQVMYKLKTYKDGKVTNVKMIENWEDAFPCKGDKKWSQWLHIQIFSKSYSYHLLKLIEKNISYSYIYLLYY